MDRRELASLVRALSVTMREVIAAEVRELKEQVQEVKVYVDQRIRDITPPLQVKGEPGKDADPVDYVLVAAQIQAEVDRRLESSLRAAIAEIPIINGIDGKDADMESILARVDSQVKDAVSAIPAPKDGKDAEPVNIEAVIQEAVKRIPPPINGKDADPVDVQFVVTEVLRQIPVPKDGKDADMDAVRSLVAGEVSRAVAEIPVPKNGKDAVPIDMEAVITEVVKRIPAPRDGKDAEPIHPDSIRLMVTGEVSKAIAELPKPKDGNDGRDALNADILPTIDESKSFPRGTVATYRGGLWKAIRTTEPTDGRSLDQVGWEVIVDGVAGWKITQSDDDPRIFIAECARSSGKSETLKAYFPIPLYREIWRDTEEYRHGDVVQRDGSGWICTKDGTKTQPGIPNSDWKLVIKRGRDGKDAKPGEKGPKGDKGDPGRDLTQMDSSGKKW